MRLLPPRRKIDRTYLQIHMCPLSMGALQPVRQTGRTSTAAIVVAVLAALLVVVAPLVFFLSIFGDPYERGFVERRDDGIYAQLRPCEGDSIHTIDVPRYDELAADLPDPFLVRNLFRRGVELTPYNCSRPSSTWKPPQTTSHRQPSTLSSLTEGEHPSPG